MPSACTPTSKSNPKNSAATPAVAPADASPKVKRVPNAAFARPMAFSDALTAVIGAGPAPRTEVTKRVWDYIKAHKLQDPAKGSLINPDAKLLVVLGAPQVTMFQMTRLISAHLR